MVAIHQMVFAYSYHITSDMTVDITADMTEQCIGNMPRAVTCRQSRQSSVLAICKNLGRNLGLFLDP